jgi:Uma2 family endonuclease
MSTMTIPAVQPLAPLAVGGSDQKGVCSDDDLYEIVNGQSVEVPPMSMFAVLINTCLIGHLWNFITSRKLGRLVCEGKFILDTAKKFQRIPDLAFVSAQTWPLDRPVSKVGDWQVVPDLAVEVVSPNDVLEEVLTKIMEYFAHGVKCVWLVSPISAKVFVFDSPQKVTLLGVADELDGGELLPGFRLKLSELFESTVTN